MKYAYALLALAAAVSAAPAPAPEAAPEAQPDAAPAAAGYGKYADYGKYPPPAGGYGKYADYGKYKAKDKREAEASPDGYGKYANYGKPSCISLAFSHAHTTKAITLLPRVATASTQITASTVPRTNVRPNLRPSLKPALTATVNTPTMASTLLPRMGTGSMPTTESTGSEELGNETRGGDRYRSKSPWLVGVTILTPFS